MTALAQNGTASVQARSRTHRYVVKTSTVVYSKSLVGINSDGDLVPWADTAGFRFIGLVDGPSATGNDAATPPVHAIVDDHGATLVGVDVTGVNDRDDIGVLVYGTSDNPTDLTLTPTTNVKAIGRLKDWRSNSDMDVALFTPHEAANQSLVSDITALTDNSGGGAADGTIGVVTAPTALTDNGGGTADGTVASEAAPTTLTDSTGLSGSHDDTLSATTVPAALTENSGVIGGTSDGNLPALVDPSGDAGASVIAGIREVAERSNTLRTLIGVMAQNASDTGQKVIELVTLAGTARDNLKEVTTTLAADRTAIVALTDAVKELATKVNEIIADLNVN